MYRSEVENTVRSTLAVIRGTHVKDVVVDAAVDEIMKTVDKYAEEQKNEMMRVIEAAWRDSVWGIITERI